MRQTPDNATATWNESSPEAQGMSSSDLAEALEFAHTNDLNIHSLTIVRNGVMVLDAYFYPYARGMRHDVASVSKSVVSLLVGMAIDDRYLDDSTQYVVPVLPRVTTRALDARVSRIRIEDLLSMRSGLRCGLDPGEPELAAMRRAEDWVEYVLRLPIAAEPGTQFAYCSPNFHVLSAAIAAVTGRTTLEFAHERLFGPMGITDVHWPADTDGINHGWGDLQLRPGDMAKIGSLMVHRGRWDERQLVSRGWIETALTARATVNGNEDYGLGWWLSRRVSGLFEANGRGGQRISVVPERNLVVVMTGGGFEPGDIGGFLLRAVRADAALPEDAAGRARLNRALRSIEAPPEPRPVRRVATASGISDRTYRFGENRLGLSSFSVELSNAAEGLLHLGLATGATLVQPLGLDGVYRISSDDTGAASAGRAEWLPDGRLRIELNRMALINRYIIDAEFSADIVRIVVAEPTELGSLTLQGDAFPESQQ